MQRSQSASSAPRAARSFASKTWVSSRDSGRDFFRDSSRSALESAAIMLVVPEESFDNKSRAVPALIKPAPPTIRIRIPSPFCWVEEMTSTRSFGDSIKNENPNADPNFLAMTVKPDKPCNYHGHPSSVTWRANEQEERISRSLALEADR